MITSINIKQLEERANYIFRNGFTCGETIVYVLNEAYELHLPDSSIAMASGFPYGFGDGGTLCGAVAGGTMVLGGIFGRSKLDEPLPNRCLNLCRELQDYIIERYCTTTCPRIIAHYEFNTPQRKDHCTALLFDVIHAFAKIMEREWGIIIES